MTLVSPPPRPQAHCSGVHAMTSSTRSRCAGNSLRPGCGLRFFCCCCAGDDALCSCCGGASLIGSRRLSASISPLDTAGSRSSNCSCRSLSVSLRLPYFWMRSRRSASLSCWITESAAASACLLRASRASCSSNFCCSCAMITAATGSSTTGKDELEKGFICPHNCRLSCGYIIESLVFTHSPVSQMVPPQQACGTTSSPVSHADRCRQEATQTARDSTAPCSLSPKASIASLFQDASNIPKVLSHRSRQPSADPFGNWRKETDDR